MSTVVRASVATRPAFEVITEAVAWGAVEGIRLRLDVVGHGVACTSTEGRIRWERDKRQAGCDPIGMAILKTQPEATMLPDAAALALESSIPHSEGIADGIAGSTKASTWERTVARHRYLAGFEAGSLIRLAILSRDCRVHGRYPLHEPSCPLCRDEDAENLARIAARGDC